MQSRIQVFTFTDTIYKNIFTMVHEPYKKSRLASLCSSAQISSAVGFTFRAPTVSGHSIKA